MKVKYFNILHLCLVDKKIVHKFVKEDILDQIDTPFQETELFLNFWSEHFINQISTVFEELINCNFKKITILADQNSKANYETIPKHITDQLDIIYIDSIHILSAKVVWGNRCEPTWNTSATKGFFPTGNLDRYNRIQMLEELYRANALDWLVWTLPKSKKQYMPAVNYYWHVCNNVPKDFDDFYNYCSSHAVNITDGISPFSFTNFMPRYISVDIPLNLYKDASFILVSETESLDNLSPLITEKIPLAIMNHRPFILAGRVGTLRRLKDMGFKTFNEYLLYPDYDNTEDNVQRLKQIAENVKVFPKILQQHQEEILDNIIHNYELLNKIANETEEKLKTLAKDYKLEYSSLSELFGLNPWVDQHYVHLPGGKNIHKPNAARLRSRENRYIKELTSEDDDQIKELNQKAWISQYNSIKADHWPTITNEDDFNNLPDQIRKECILKFNCRPTNRYI